jgi:hypothetical protein
MPVDEVLRTIDGAMVRIGARSRLEAIVIAARRGLLNLTPGS